MIVLAILYLFGFAVHTLMYLTKQYVGDAVISILMAIVGISLSTAVIINN